MVFHTQHKQYGLPYASILININFHQKRNKQGVKAANQVELYKTTSSVLLNSLRK